jgi:Spy/CpxP family protein refolding chaperone
MWTRLLWGLAGCLLVAALVATAGAQEKGQKGRGRGAGGPGFFGGGGSLVMLAGDEAVQKELGLGEAEKGKVETIGREANDARREELSSAGVDFRNIQNLSDEERRAAGEKMAAISRKVNEKFEAKLKEALTADQFKRLQEIGVQAAGPDALSDPRVSKELALTDDQNKKIADIRTDYREKTRGLFGQGAGEDARTKMRELRDEESKKLAEVLTKEQQDKLTALKGKEFDLSQIRRGGPGGPGGGRPGGKGKNRPKTE